MTDPSKRPLSFPKWHIPYLEKHRIPELFHELARELLIQKPEDHILFMKQMLQQAAANRDACRTILIGSVKVNRVAVAQEMAKSTQQLVITLQDLKRIFPLAAMQPQMIAKAIACLGRSQHSGWILADCINTEQEAKALLQLGVLPTHVVLLVPPFQPKLDEPLYCDVPERWPALRRNLFGLRGIFAQKLREVCLADRNIAAAAKDCLDICKRKPAVKTVRPRVVILGPRGCGRKTQARLLAQMMGLIHVDFEYILCQAWTSDSELGRQLRKCDKKVCFHSELLCQIVNKRVLERDCMESGWVLTGYPFTVTDFQFLDSLQTPPNRVIALDCDLNTAKERVRYRQVNVHSGSATDFNPAKVSKGHAETSKKTWKSHPKDCLALIQAEHDFYCQNYGSIKKYCGDTMLVVNGEQSERWVFECIVGHLVGGSPPGAARKGFGADIPEVCSCECIKLPSKVVKAYAMTL